MFRICDLGFGCVGLYGFGLSRVLKFPPLPMEITSLPHHSIYMHFAV